MVVVSLENETIRRATRAAAKIDTRYWARVAAAGSLAASGVLLMAGKRRAGLAVAAAATALTVYDQQETVREVWSHLPDYLADAHRFLTQAQGAVDELAAQGERLRKILSR